MNTDEILALQAGPALDQAVHSVIFGSTGKLPAYSTREASALALMDRLPLFVGRVDASHPMFDAARPFVAGLLTYDRTLSGDVTRIRVTGPTRMVALCKAALLVALRPARQEARRPQSTADAARELAARIGTPAARNPNTPKFQQPMARVHSRDQRAPMPKRPEKFVGPDVKTPS